MADSSSEALQISRERISRVVDVLSLAAIGEFDNPNCAISVAEEDEFGLLEQSLNVLTQELGATHTENERIVAELTASRRELEQRLRTIEEQQTAIKRLSTPILEVWEGILVLPVIGVVDEQRAASMTDQLLVRVVELGAHSVIVDVTGAATLDGSTADYFSRLAKSVALLGAQCVFSGISSENAMTLVRIDAEFRDVVTCANLRAGLRACLARK